ncbi:MAG: DUF4252 domain-containing protein [Gammaproteobacteria bacterium]
MKIRTLPLTILLLLLAPFALAQTTARAPGLFDFGTIPGVTSQPTVEINLNSQMLGFVRAATGMAGSEGGDVLAGVDNVRVLVYELSDNDPAILDFVDSASSALESDAWQRIVYVQEEGERVRIYVKFNETNLAGLTLLVADTSGEAVFANLAGDIDPAQLGAISQTLGISDVLGDITGVTQEALNGNEGE